MWVTVATPPYKSIEQFDAIRGAGPEPEGLAARYVGAVDDELRIVAVWESKEHADRFFTEQLAPALAKVLGPEPLGAPKISGFAAARTYERELAR